MTLVSAGCASHQYYSVAIVNYNNYPNNTGADGLRARKTGRYAPCSGFYPSSNCQSLMGISAAPQSKVGAHADETSETASLIPRPREDIRRSPPPEKCAARARRATLSPRPWSLRHDLTLS